MNHRIIAAILFFLSLIAIPFGYFLFNPEVINWCQADKVGCINQSVQYGVGLPIYMSARWLSPLFLALIFTRREVFSAWWKVILPISILALWLILETPGMYHSWIQFWPDRTNIAERMVWLIDIISAIVIAWKYWQLSRKRGKST